jgi:predicted transcriptional regulator
MPRVAIKKKEYMVADLPGWIVGRMHTMKLRQEDVAKELNITPQAFSKRLQKDDRGRPKDVFRYGDLLTIFKVLEATDEEKLRLLSL